MLKEVVLYGVTVWANCSKENLRKISRLQKHAARIILDASATVNSVALFKQLNWLAFYDDVKLNTCVLAYKGFHGICPPYLKDILTCNADTQTRWSGRYSKRNLVCSRYSSVIEGGRISTSKLWNSLPAHVKTSEQPVKTFKHELFKYFLNTYNVKILTFNLNNDVIIIIDGE